MTLERINDVSENTSEKLKGKVQLMTSRLMIHEGQRCTQATK